MKEQEMQQEDPIERMEVGSDQCYSVGLWCMTKLALHAWILSIFSLGEKKKEVY